MPDSPKIFPLGTGALTVDFGNRISVDLNEQATSLAEYLEANPFPGFIETLPAYASVAIFYDPNETRRAFPDSPNSFEAVRDLLGAALRDLPARAASESRVVEISVDFGQDAALDLAYIAEHGGLTRSDAIELFISKTYRVYMIGFLPGFAYMGEVDEQIATPRRSSPRLKVPRGSVGIAGRQTGIYPLESPGGWQIIGRTSMNLFDAAADPPSVLKAGDSVRFVRV